MRSGRGIYRERSLSPEGKKKERKKERQKGASAMFIDVVNE